MKALITGSKGQDGIYLSEFLKTKGYVVYGFDKGENSNNYVVDEIYNLAGITNSETSFEIARETFEVNTLLCLEMLELARKTGAKIFQASSSMQNGLTPYGISKLASHKLTQMYRNVLGVYAVSGILHNHVSPLSKGTVVNKICNSARNGEKPSLGNVSAKRDWMHAKDAVRAMWFTLQQPKADDYEICTGVVSSIGDVIREAYGYIPEIDVSDSNLKRGDQDILCGNPDRIKSIGWAPVYDLKGLIRELME